MTGGEREEEAERRRAEKSWMAMWTHSSSGEGWTLGSKTILSAGPWCMEDQASQEGSATAGVVLLRNPALYLWPHEYSLHSGLQHLLPRSPKEPILPPSPRVLFLQA